MSRWEEETEFCQIKTPISDFLVTLLNKVWAGAYTAYLIIRYRNFKKCHEHIDKLGR